MTYTYWLEEIETSGTTSEYGPASAPAQAAALGHAVFAPIAAR